jgi:hypothetical protein
VLEVRSVWFDALAISLDYDHSLPPNLAEIFTVPDSDEEWLADDPSASDAAAAGQLGTHSSSPHCGELLE